MKIAICYYSTHHGNTLKVAKAMTQGHGADFIDLSTQQGASLEGYDLIGFASGIYAFSFHPSVIAFARKCLPQGKPVCYMYTYGGAKGTGTREIARLAREKNARVLGEFGCRGYNTFGPFRLVGGSGKGRPTQEDLQRARSFFQELMAKL